MLAGTCHSPKLLGMSHHHDHVFATWQPFVMQLYAMLQPLDAFLTGGPQSSDMRDYNVDALYYVLSAVVKWYRVLLPRDESPDEPSGMPPPVEELSPVRVPSSARTFLVSRVHHYPLMVYVHLSHRAFGGRFQRVQKVSHI